MAEQASADVHLNNWGRFEHNYYDIMIYVVLYIPTLVFLVRAFAGIHISLFIIIYKNYCM